MFHGKGEEFNSFGVLIKTLFQIGSAGAGVLSVAISDLKRDDYDDDFNLILGYLFGLYSAGFISFDSLSVLQEKLIQRDFD